MLSVDPEVAAAAVVTAHPAPMPILGVPRVFALTGDPPFLLDDLGQSADGIVAAGRNLLGGGHGGGHA